MCIGVIPRLRSSRGNPLQTLVILSLRSRRENPLRWCRRLSDGDCRVVEAQATILYFPQAENTGCVLASPLPTKAIRLCGDPFVWCLAMTEYLCALQQPKKGEPYGSPLIVHYALCIITGPACLPTGWGAHRWRSVHRSWQCTPGRRRCSLRCPKCPHWDPRSGTSENSEPFR